MKQSLLIVGLVACFHVSGVQASDWAHWRGPEQNGVSREKNLPDRMSLDPNAADSNVVWKQPFGGRAAPIILNGRVYIINSVGFELTEQERVMCFDAETGKVLWEHRFNIFHTDIVSNRIGWTNLAGDPETGNIYAHGVQGLMFCFDRDGKVIWSHSMTEEYGRITGYGGRVTSPIVDGDLLILGLVNASWGDQARGGNRFVAFDKRTGVPVWWGEAPGMRGTYYSIPVVAIINGQRLLVTGGSDGGVHAFKVRTGERVWSYQLGARAINNAPVVAGNLVYASHGEENEDTNVQGRVACLDAGKIVDGKPALVWKEDGLRVGFASPILHEGRLYVCDDKAKLYCLEAKNGKKLWEFKYGRTARGSPVWADGKIYVCEVASKIHILKPGDKRCDELHAQFFPSPGGTEVVELNGTPSIANGKVYFNTRDDLFCIGKKGNSVAADPIPPQTPEPAADPAGKPAHLQVIPAEIMVQAGDQATFKARLYDAQGRFLRETKATWTLPSPPPPQGSTTAPPPLQGEISPEGVLTVSKTLPGQQGPVVAKAEGLTGRARVRVAPRMPYAMDFEKVPEERTPGGWINAQGKFAVVKVGNDKLLKKLANNPNPLLARANAYIGPANWSNYTIEADVMGFKEKNDLPDMGVVNSRYTLMLDGNKQFLRLMSWEALPRIDKTVPFQWAPKSWYHMKFRVEPKGDKVLARGKVWPRGQPEPVAWSIEFEDPVPNREGAAALYGYATGILEGGTGAEIFYDNVKVTPNK